MISTPRTIVPAALAALALAFVPAAGAADPQQPRPGKGGGDANHDHTAPPGQAPAGGGQPGDPARGCHPR